MLVAININTHLDDVTAFSILVIIFVVPVLVAAGMPMWQAARLRRLFARQRSPAVTKHAKSA